MAHKKWGGLFCFGLVAIGGYKFIEPELFTFQSLPRYTLNAQTASEETAQIKSVFSKTAGIQDCILGGRRQNYGDNQAAMVVKDNKILFSCHPDMPIPPASLTKLMTAVLVMDALNHRAIEKKTVLYPSGDTAREDPHFFPKSGTVSLEDSFSAMLTYSSNSAAALLATKLAGTETQFAEMMTKKAKEIGMHNTVFKNASGLPAQGQITTARDMIILGDYIKKNYPKYTPYFHIDRFKGIQNHAKDIAADQDTDIVKTGFTNASGFHILVNQGRVSAVVLGFQESKNRNAEVKTLLAHKF